MYADRRMLHVKVEVLLRHQATVHCMLLVFVAWSATGYSFTAHWLLSPECTILESLVHQIGCLAVAHFQVNKGKDAAHDACVI